MILETGMVLLNERKRRMTTDLRQFLPYVEHCNLTEAQKLELLADLWSIMESFADEAWGIVEKNDFANDNDQFSRIKSLNTIDYMHADNANAPLPEAGQSARSQANKD
ncbi:hypothetical protein DLM45_05375 [Hyphomicrobium methylovorum]|nr:hypothetical protein [Hyphomicrobium methylovorum]